MEEGDGKVPTKITIKDGRKPAEIFRTDLITAMKIPDHQVIPPGSYFDLTDPWKQEWERGVQVPVNMGSLPQTSFQFTDSVLHLSSDFKMPNKLVKAEEKDGKEKKVTYDLDDEDVVWLRSFNKSRRNKGLEVVDEFLLEKAITYLEDQCYTNMGETISTEKGLSIEYDEDISCDVCRVPDCEESNEIIFCDVCNVAVHQACYGVQKVPVGSWICKPCSQLLSNTSCLLCPNKGGAMKKANSKGYKGWIHMSCALWVPEVGIGDVEKMEPITRIDAITPGRWNLLCYICKERKGACIQCSVKTCVTAFHVTCGFDNNLEMQTVWDESAPDGVRHVCYCYKHGPKRGNKSPRRSPRKFLTGTRNYPPRGSRRSSCTSPSKATARNEEEKENIRQKKLRGMEEEFYLYAYPEDLASELQISADLAKTFHHFWTIKRKSRDDASLLPPTAEQQECLAGRQVKPYQRASMEIERVVRLRQDLERIRNLCYMVEKREKLKRDLTRARETVFWKELDVVRNISGKITSEDRQWARSCCANNFTEYETLQSLDFNYHKKSKTYKRRKRRRRQGVQKRVSTFSGEENSSSGIEVKKGCFEDKETLNTEGNKWEIQKTLSADEIVEATSLGEHLDSSVGPKAKTSSHDRTDEEVSGEASCDDPTNKRLREMSSDSDFEDESHWKEKRRSSNRRRFVKLPNNDQRKNGIINLSETMPDQSTDRINGLRLNIPKNGELRYRKNRDVNTSTKMYRPFSRKIIRENFNSNKPTTVLDECSRKRDHPNLKILPCRRLRSNDALLDGKMALGKCDIPVSPSRTFLGNMIPLSPKSGENVVQNGTSQELERPVFDATAEGLEKQVLEITRRKQRRHVSDSEVRTQEVSKQELSSLHGVFYRTRSRSSSGEPGFLPSPTKTASRLPRRFSADRKIVINAQTSVSAQGCVVGRCRTRQSPGKLQGSLETPFNNTSGGDQFFDKFRRTATTSA